MPILNNPYWTLRLDSPLLIPIEPVEPEDFIHEISGKVLCGTDDDERDRVGGCFRVYYADFGLGQDYGVDGDEVLDAYEHTFEYVRVVLDSDGHPFSSRLNKLLDDEIWNLNFLILDRLELLPRYRGNGAGITILRCLIERFGAGAGIAGLKPFPLQFETRKPTQSSWNGRLNLEAYSSDLKSSTRKLRQYYEQLGFVTMKSTPFMFRSMSLAFATQSK